MGVKISQLPSGTAEQNAVVPVTSADSSVTRKVTLSSIVSLATKDTVGLGNVDNTSDLNKPVSTATQTALDVKLSADQLGSTIAALEEVAPVTTDDLFLVVDDPGSTPVIKKATGAVVRDSLLNQAANLQLNRGTSAEVSAYTALEGEPVWATDTKILYVGDGATTGGVPVGKYPIDGQSASGANAGKIRISPDLVPSGSSAPSFTNIGDGGINLQLQPPSSSGNICGKNSAIIGGQNNTATGGNSCVLAGAGGTADARAEVCIGFDEGYGQSKRLIYAGTTTATNRTLDISFDPAIMNGPILVRPARYVMSHQPNCIWAGTLNICATTANGNEVAHFIRKFIYRQRAESSGFFTTWIPEMVGTPTVVGTDVNPSNAYSISFGGHAGSSLLPNTRMTLTVSGPAATVRWFGVADVVQLSFNGMS